MTDELDENMLSAYFDGELTAAEREAVDRWLAESPIARKRLAEIESISRMLREGPHPRLDADFAAEVMQQAERRTLLPETQPRPESANPRRLRHLAGWLSVAVAVIASIILWPRPQADQVANGNNNIAEAPGPVVPVPPPEAVKLAAVAPEFQFAAVMPQTRPTDLIGVFQQAGSKITVVQLFVHDLPEAEQQLQALLTSHQVAPPADATIDPQSAELAVYVSAPQGELTGIMAELKRQSALRAVAIGSLPEQADFARSMEKLLAAHGTAAAPQGRQIVVAADLLQQTVTRNTEELLASVMQPIDPNIRRMGPLNANTAGDGAGGESQRRVLFLLTRVTADSVP